MSIFGTWVAGVGTCASQLLKAGVGAQPCRECSGDRSSTVENVTVAEGGDSCSGRYATGSHPRELSSNSSGETRGGLGNGHNLTASPAPGGYLFSSTSRTSGDATSLPTASATAAPL
jgi:hypothetical protein